jgi:nucleoporin SEH1
MMRYHAAAVTHGAMIHDISFDFYGRRLATCSSDKSIKIVDLDEETFEPSKDEVRILNAHNDSIWRLSWAHPEFGQLIASCSQDKFVHIWEEQENLSAKSKTDRRWWQKKTQLTDSKECVRDVKFAPRHLGLKIASASADGFVRIYEATDVFTLNYWPLQESFQAEKVTGADKDSDNGLLSLSWNDSPFEPAKIVVGGYSGKAAIWTYDTSGGWRKELTLGEQNKEQNRVISDVAWAPCMGRSYHLIATADMTDKIQIYEIVRPSDGGALRLDEPPQTLSIKSDEDESSGMQRGNVWRLAWNATGTVLATSADTGLDLWRRNFEGKWERVQSIPKGQ